MNYIAIPISFLLGISLLSFLKWATEHEDFDLSPSLVWPLIFLSILFTVSFATYFTIGLLKDLRGEDD